MVITYACLRFVVLCLPFTVESLFPPLADELHDVLLFEQNYLSLDDV